MNKTIIALLAGITVGLLIAPDKGSATRRKLSDTLRDLKRLAREEAAEFAEEGYDQYTHNQRLSLVEKDII